ncbi:MAG: ABC transporter permease [Terriglobia bacterium]
MGRYLPLITKSVLRNRRRSLLTIASIAISFCLIGVLAAMYRTLFTSTANTTPGEALRLIVHNRASLTLDLPVSYERKIEAIPGVRAVTRLVWFGATYKDPNNPKYRFGQFAIEPSQLFAVHPEYGIPEDQKAAFEREKTACVASEALAAKLGWKLGDRITLVNQNLQTALDLTLVGIYTDPNDSSGGEPLYFNWDYLNDTLPASSDLHNMIQQYHVETISKGAVASVAKSIDAMFRNAPYPTKTESEQAFMLSFVSFLGNLKLFLAAIFGAVTFTVLLVSTNTLSMSVRERIREIGIMKTLGFTRGVILGIILGEAGIIALAGGVIGCGLAGVLCNVIRQSPGMAIFLKTLSVTPAVAAICLVAALLIGFASALAPALGAARTSIVESLRYTG